jgi:hypothetical protein
MRESPRSARAGAARDYLEGARARPGKGSRVQRAADCGLRLLSRLLDGVRGEIDGWEMAELAAVYDTLATLVADTLGLDAADALSALALLCGDEEALRLTRGRPETNLAMLGLLMDGLLWVTVTYESGPRGQSLRVTEVAYRKATGDLRSAKAAVEFAYEDLPGRVRERMLTTGQHAVRYQLYPAPTSAPSAPDDDVTGADGRRRP